MRTKTIIRRGGVQVGSSDFERAKAAREALKEAHEENIKSFSHSLIMHAPVKEPSDNTMVLCWCLTGWVKVEYARVKSAKFNNWKY